MLIHFTARMNSDRMIWFINVKHATAQMVILVWRYNYPYSIIIIAYYYYMYLCLFFVSDTHLSLGCSTLVSVTIYIVCSVLFDITYARLFTWTVYITLNYLKIMRQRFSIAFYHCNHKLFIQNLPFCSQLTNYGKPNIYKIFLNRITILIVYNTYIVRMCIQNVTAVLVLMHIWKSTPHN